MRLATGPTAKRCATSPRASNPEREPEHDADVANHGCGESFRGSGQDHAHGAACGPRYHAGRAENERVKEGDGPTPRVTGRRQASVEVQGSADKGQGS